MYQTVFKLLHWIKLRGENLKKKIRLSQRYENLQTILLNWQFFICTAKSNLTMINLLHIHITWHNVKRKKNCTPLKFVHVETWHTKLVMMTAVLKHEDGLKRLEAASCLLSDHPSVRLLFSYSKSRMCSQMICNFSFINFCKWATH